MEFETDLKIGTLGEQTFSTWCSAAHLTSNRSLEEDRTGWDHQVEFPYIKTHLPRDKQLSPIQCRVQVKSTQRRDRKWSIKASVIKRLIDYSYPSFLLFLEFTNDSKPVVESAFLVHIDKRIIERTLRALRKNDTQKAPKELHELKISISYSKKDKLQTASGETFRDSIVKYVPNGDITKYQKEKRKTIETVGYGEGSYRLQFQIAPEELDKHIIAQSIGLGKEPVKVSNSVIFDNRFNLKNGSIEIKRCSEAKLTLQPNVLDTCQLRFREDEFSPSINFDGEFVSSTNIYTVDKNKLFFRTSLFSFELGSLDDNGKFDAKLHFTLEKEVPLDEVIKVFRLFHKNNVGKQLLCEVELFKEHRTLNLQVEMEYDFKDARLVADTLCLLKDSFSIDGGTLTTPDEMFVQRDRLDVLARAIQNQVDGLRVSFADAMQEYPEVIKIPYTIIAEIGKLTIGVITLFHGTKIEANNYQVIKSEVLKPLVFNNEVPSNETLEQLEQEAVEKIK
ncbi:hypothetical protein BBL97_06980 [Vibrio parahaemolyticus]|uniref:hypothetical protein n=1 Tax=Vibrio parahaemolyticus TaxID=670 RepID=UPI00049F084F|nr:hypothetical protein [Vibrio parahaemolyticus]KCV75979.1 hypothetical protein Y011_02355 [Vibrio parahaemolyticus VP49]ELB2878594.1 hypothetical protein [Vibrio parahaemolyticus]ODW99346.1 hypothetical protein BBL95_01145 [Vibrio parahaemolyticus]ODX02731.1 hypothetical protein BBL98_19085 [Vibrio parahaemolyticus]ODX06577.1 hypothetical protein BBL96_13100 [Vibrio parahaemolyticus]